MRSESKPNQLPVHRAFAAKRRRHLGFTLIEMLVVVSMILILLSIALPMYSHHIQRSRETLLLQNLKTLNDAVDNYSLDKGHAPQQIDDLVQAGYIKSIPNDITGSNTWKTEPEDPQKAWDENQPGIGRIYSGSEEVGSDGAAYSSWPHTN
jgi:general secretion pathway protein G